MGSRSRTIVVATLAFVAGVLLTAGVGYLITRPIVEFWAFAPYQSAASMGKLYVRMLRDLREGEADRTVSTLENLLDGELITLGTYVARGDRVDGTVIESVRTMREYREQYPTTHPDEDTRAAIERGLDLSESKSVP